MIDLDNTAPTAVLPSAPTNPTNNNLDLTVSGTDVEYYQYAYKVDAGSYNGYSVITPVANNIVLSNLADGVYTLKAIGRDASGNWQADASAATYIWTIDATKPIIDSITSDATATGWLKVGDKINFTLTLQNSEVNSTVAGAYNDHDLTWTEQPDDKTFIATYTIAEGDTDQITALQITEVTVTDAANNTSDPVAGSDINKTIDANISVIDFITSDATSAGWLKVGDTINFTLTPAGTELNATVVGSYNGTTLSWNSLDVGVTYGATYTITEGDTDQFVPLQITGVIITDAAGNISNSANGADIVKIIDANTPDTSLLSTFAGQTLTGGVIYPLNWEATDDNFGATPIGLEYSINGGGSWIEIVGVTENDGSYSWMAPSVNTSMAMLRLTATDEAKNSMVNTGGTFTINYSETPVTPDTTSPVIMVNSPNGGENLEAGSIHVITWTANDNITPASDLEIELEYSLNGSANWNEIDNTENDGAYIWTIPEGVNSDNCLIRVTTEDAYNNIGSDISNSVFSIAEPVVEPIPICTELEDGQWTCDIELNEGWNLISLPVILNETTIANVLSGVDDIDNIQVVKYYEDDEWFNYIPGELAELTTMEDGKGYWINMDNDDVLTVTGIEMPAFPNPSPAYEVIQEWNLIGLKSISARMLSSIYLQSLTGSYILSDQNNINRNNDYMYSGKGYWLWANENGTIVTFNE